LLGKIRGAFGGTEVMHRKLARRRPGGLQSQLNQSRSSTRTGTDLL
jgi:hypothetical protein